MGAVVSLGLVSCQPSDKSELTLEQRGDTLTLVRITNPTKYLLLPVEEKTAEGQVCLVTGDPADTDMDVRLARKNIDYFVPFELPAGTKRRLSVSVKRRKTRSVGNKCDCRIRSMR